MKDELFTMTPEMPAMSPEMLARWQEELRRNSLRMKHFSEMVMNPKEPEVGPTPRRGDLPQGQVTALALRFEAHRTRRRSSSCPISASAGPYIFDLMHKGSFIEHMTEQGFDFYLVDWGVFGPEDNGLTLEYAVTKILPRLARKALESSGAKEMSVLGYCMGAPLSMLVAGQHARVSREELHRHGGAHRLQPGRAVRALARWPLLRRGQVRGHAGGDTGGHGQDGLQAPQAHHGSLHESSISGGTCGIRSTWPASTR